MTKERSSGRIVNGKTGCYAFAGRTLLRFAIVVADTVPRQGIQSGSDRNARARHRIECDRVRNYEHDALSRFPACPTERRARVYPGTSPLGANFDLLSG